MCLGTWPGLPVVLSVSTQCNCGEKAGMVGHALAPPQGYWKVHISPKCHFNYNDPP